MTDSQKKLNHSLDPFARLSALSSAPTDCVASRITPIASYAIKHQEANQGDRLCAPCLSTADKPELSSGSKKNSSAKAQSARSQSSQRADLSQPQSPSWAADWVVKKSQSSHTDSNEEPIRAKKHESRSPGLVSSNSTNNPKSLDNQYPDEQRLNYICKNFDVSRSSLAPLDNHLDFNRQQQQREERETPACSSLPVIPLHFQVKALYTPSIFGSFATQTSTRKTPTAKLKFSSKTKEEKLNHLADEAKSTSLSCISLNSFDSYSTREFRNAVQPNSHHPRQQHLCPHHPTQALAQQQFQAQRTVNANSVDRVDYIIEKIKMSNASKTLQMIDTSHKRQSPHPSFHGPSTANMASSKSPDPDPTGFLATSSLIYCLSPEPSAPHSTTLQATSAQSGSNYATPMGKPVASPLLSSNSLWSDPPEPSTAMSSSHLRHELLMPMPPMDSSWPTSYDDLARTSSPRSHSLSASMLHSEQDEPYHGGGSSHSSSMSAVISAGHHSDSASECCSAESEEMSSSGEPCSESEAALFSSSLPNNDGALHAADTSMETSLGLPLHASNVAESWRIVGSPSMSGQSGSGSGSAQGQIQAQVQAQAPAGQLASHRRVESRLSISTPVSRCTSPAAPDEDARKSENATPLQHLTTAAAVATDPTTASNSWSMLLDASDIPGNARFFRARALSDFELRSSFTIGDAVTISGSKLSTSTLGTSTPFMGRPNSTLISSSSATAASGSGSTPTSRSLLRPTSSASTSVIEELTNAASRLVVSPPASHASSNLSSVADSAYSSPSHTPPPLLSASLSQSQLQAVGLMMDASWNFPDAMKAKMTSRRPFESRSEDEVAVNAAAGTTATPVSNMSACSSRRSSLTAEAAPFLPSKLQHQIGGSMPAGPTSMVLDVDSSLVDDEDLANSNMPIMMHPSQQRLLGVGESSFRYRSYSDPYRLQQLQQQQGGVAAGAQSSTQGKSPLYYAASGLSGTSTQSNTYEEAQYNSIYMHHSHAMPSAHYHHQNGAALPAYPNPGQSSSPSPYHMNYGPTPYGPPGYMSPMRSASVIGSTKSSQPAPMYSNRSLSNSNLAALSPSSSNGGPVASAGSLHPSALSNSKYKGPLYIVEFKSGRSEIFYVPSLASSTNNSDEDDNSSTNSESDDKSKAKAKLPDGSRVGLNDWVIVEADRGEDLGRVSGLVSVEWLQAQMMYMAALSAASGAAEEDDPDSGHLTSAVVNPAAVASAAAAIVDLKTTASRTGCLFAPSMSIPIDGQTSGSSTTYQPSFLSAKELVPKRIHRLATLMDLRSLSAKSQEEALAVLRCTSRVRSRRLPMDIVDAEYQWDRNKLTFYFKSECRIDFRELVRELFRIYKTRIWMCAVERRLGGLIHMASNESSSPSSR